MNKFVLCAILTSIFALPIYSAESNKPSTGGGGWRESYGGDSTIMEFKHLAKEVAYVLNDNSFPNDFNIDLINLKDTINLSYVQCGSDLVLDGVSKDAINYPNENPQRIVLNCKKWNSELSTSQKYRLAIHEYLPLVRIDDSTYSYSEKMYNFFVKYRNASNFNMQDMMSSILSCNLAGFRKMTDLGGNVFLENQRGINLLQIATAFSCDVIVQDLIDSGLEYVINDIINMSYAHYSLIENAITTTFGNEQAQAISTLKILITKWPGLPSLGFTSNLWLSGDYQLEKKCYPRSTVMHLLASKKVITKETYAFIKQLIDLGFSLDQKNICEQTPRAIFEKNNIHF